MDIEEALRWVDRNCTDAATLDRLRSRMVAKTLAEEVKRLRNLQEKIDDAALFERDACMNFDEFWNSETGPQHFAGQPAPKDLARAAWNRAAALECAMRVQS